MNVKAIKVQIIALASVFSTVSYAQDLGTEVINVVRSYTPSVLEAEKVKETPQIGDTLSTQKKQVNYSIFSVPVASTFTPAKGKATTVETVKPEKFYRNYATLGFGNYTSVLGELYSSFDISRTDNFDLFLKHNSSQGGIDKVQLNDAFYDTSLDVNYTSRQRDMSYRVGFGVLHQIYNWYGLPESEIFTSDYRDNIDPKHSFFGVNANGNLAFNESIFSGGDVSIRYFGDSFSSSEIALALKPNFEFEMEGLDVGIKASVDFLSGSFKEDYVNNGSELAYQFVLLGVQPYIQFQDEDYSIALGAKVVLGMNTEHSTNDIFVYPKVSASYNLIDELVTIYAGADGDLDQNTYFGFAQENPFVSPTLYIAPTNRMYDAFAGIKGKFVENVSYNLKASYKNEEAKPLFTGNYFAGNAEGTKGYRYGNSFGVMYDDVSTLEVFGEIQAQLSKTFSLGVNANVYSYNTDRLDEAYNLPAFKASVFANGSFSDKFFGGADLFFVGERQDMYMGVEDFQTGNNITLDGYFDVNLHLGYNINNQLSVFAKGNNLLGDSYEKWQNTPVLGLQVMGGVTYKFDW